VKAWADAREWVLALPSRVVATSPTSASEILRGTDYEDDDEDEDDDDDDDDEDEDEDEGGSG